MRSISVSWRTPFLILACVCLFGSAVPYQSAHSDGISIDPPNKRTPDSTNITAPTPTGGSSVDWLYLMVLVLITT